MSKGEEGKGGNDDYKPIESIERVQSASMNTATNATIGTDNANESTCTDGMTACPPDKPDLATVFA